MSPADRANVGGKVVGVVWAGLIVSIAVSGSGCASRAERARRGTQQPTSILELIAPPTPAEAAAWAVDPFDADKRYRGTLLLANAPWGGERVYVDLYERSTTDADSSVRAAGVRGLALHGGPEHLDLIVAQSGNEDRLLRWECVRAMQRLHGTTAVAALLARVSEAKESEAMVRSASASALGQYAEPRVVDALIGALRDRDLSVNREALGSLRTLTGQDFGFNSREWVSWRESSDRLFAGRTPYVYPVFWRERNFAEVILPFVWRPPNETASTPIGMDVSSAPGDGWGGPTASEKVDEGDSSVRRK